ncbi:MAG: hypothetical protein O3C67_13590 [Cyanobacteria bacterium]|nr:hypothetical protein [Cyanobacteriota bacterium]
MFQEFIPHTEIYAPPPATDKDPAPIREPVIITVIGSALGVELIVNVLHRLGFAEARAWSKSQIDPRSGKSMRVLTKWIRH